MGFWQDRRRQAIAAIYRPAMRRHDQFISPYKRDLFRAVRGQVLEIGPGPGSNLPYLNQVESWTGIEPNRFMHRLIHEQLKQTGVQGTVLETAAESLPFPDRSFDAALGTLVLCSVFSPERVLRELCRVLRPGGRFFLIEHVAAPRGTWLRRIQRLASPLWRCCGDGCHPDRETAETIARGGFRRMELQEFRAPWNALPFVVSPHIAGWAEVA